MASTGVPWGSLEIAMVSGLFLFRDFMQKRQKMAIGKQIDKQIAEKPLQNLALAAEKGGTKWQQFKRK